MLPNTPVPLGALMESAPKTTLGRGPLHKCHAASRSTHSEDYLAKHHPESVVRCASDISFVMLHQ